MNQSTLDQARAAKAKILAKYGKTPTVNGVGITRIDGGYGVKLNLETPPSPEATFPKQIDGVPIRLEVVGFIGKG